MSIYHRFYIKQINLELEVEQSIYVQKIMVFGHIEWLAILQDVSGFSCT